MKTSKKIKEAKERLGIKRALKSEQLGAIKRTLDGKDTIVILPVGFGKSAIAQIPAIVEQKHPTIIFEPTISLMYDQVKRLQNLGIAAEFLSNRNKKDHKRILSDYAEGDVTILYVAPERLDSPNFVAAMLDNPPWLVVIDEAHCVLEWGRSFRPHYLQISNFIDMLVDRPTILAMTATAPPEYREDLRESLGMREPKIITCSLDRPNLTLISRKMKSEHIEARCKYARRLIEESKEKGRVVVYCPTKKEADIVYNDLCDKYPNDVVECHSFMESDKRENHEMKFITGKCRIMVATTAFGMGIDVPDIRLIVHTSLPISPIGYYQEIGRAGRDGDKSKCVMLYDDGDVKKYNKILDDEEEKHGAKARRRLEQRIKDMKRIANGDQCFMQAVLEYLGEDDAKTCGKCSVCQGKKGFKNVRYFED